MIIRGVELVLICDQSLVGVGEVGGDSHTVRAQRVHRVCKGTRAVVVGGECVSDEGDVGGAVFAGVAGFREFGCRQGCQGSPPAFMEFDEKRGAGELDEFGKIGVDDCMSDGGGGGEGGRGEKERGA